MVEATAILALCLMASILALAGVSITLALVLYKRFGQRESEVGQDIAEKLISSWNAGSETHRNMVNDIQAETTIAAETRIRRQQFRRPEASLRDAMGLEDDKPVTLGTFGQAPMIPEMVTPGLEGL